MAKVTIAAPTILARGKVVPLVVTITRAIQIGSIPPLISQITDVTATRPVFWNFSQSFCKFSS